MARRILNCCLEVPSKSHQMIQGDWLTAGGNLNWNNCIYTGQFYQF